MILLHRPFVAKNYIQPSPRVGKGPLHAREMCVRSAMDIANLLRCFERQYSLRRSHISFVHTAFTAALILVFATVSDSRNNIQDQLTEHLNVCCNALAELGQAYENASRSLDILLATKRSWQARLVVSLRGKRPSWHGSQTSHDSARKRLRGSSHMT